MFLHFFNSYSQSSIIYVDGFFFTPFIAGFSIPAVFVYFQVIIYFAWIFFAHICCVT